MWALSAEVVRLRTELGLARRQLAVLHSIITAAPCIVASPEQARAYLAAIKRPRASLQLPQHALTGVRRACHGYRQVARKPACEPVGSRCLRARVWRSGCCGTLLLLLPIAPAL